MTQRSPAPPADAILLTVDQVAVMLQCGPRSVHAWSKDGKMPGPVHIQRASRWRRDQLEQWVRAGCPKMTANAQGATCHENTSREQQKGQVDDGD